MAEAEPEVEDVAEQVEGAQLPALLGQKGEQPPVGRVVGGAQVGVGKKDIPHGEPL